MDLGWKWWLRSSKDKELGSPRDFLRRVARLALSLPENHAQGTPLKVACQLARAGDVEEAKAIAVRSRPTRTGGTFLGGKELEIIEMVHLLAEAGSVKEALALAKMVGGESEREGLFSDIGENALHSGHVREFLARADQFQGIEKDYILRDFVVHLAKAGKLKDSVHAASLVEDDSRRADAFKEAAAIFGATGQIALFTTAVRALENARSRNSAFYALTEFHSEKGDLETAVEAASEIGPDHVWPLSFFGARKWDGLTLTPATVVLADKIPNPKVQEGLVSTLAHAFSRCGRTSDFVRAAEACSRTTLDLALCASVSGLAEYGDFASAQILHERIADETLQKRSRKALLSAREEADALQRLSPADAISRLRRDILDSQSEQFDDFMVERVLVAARIGFRIADVAISCKARGLRQEAKEALSLIGLLSYRQRKSALDQVGSSLPLQGHVDLLFEALEFCEKPLDRNRVLNQAVGILATKNDLEHMGECLSRITEPEAARNAFSRIAAYFSLSGAGADLMPRIAGLSDRAVRDKLRIALGTQLASAGQLEAAKEWLGQVESAAERERALVEFEKSARGPAKTASGREAVTGPTELQEKKRLEFLEDAALDEEIENPLTRLLSPITAAGRLEKSRPAVAKRLFELVASGDLDKAVRLVSGSADEQALSLTAIAEHLADTEKRGRLPRVIADAIWRCGGIKDRGAKVLELLSIAVLTASEKATGGRTLKPQFTPADRRLAVSLLEELSR
jgi:hypothetical protein